jgi:hypothetical protein
MNAMERMMMETPHVFDFKPVTCGRPRGSVRPEPAHVCQVCGERRSRFIMRGVAKADSSHTLCFECYRAVVNRARAQRLSVEPELKLMPSAKPVAARLRGNREAHYASLLTRRRQAQIAARHALEGLSDFLPAAAAVEALQKVS